MKQKIIRSGNSAVVTVPADFLKTVGSRIGDEVMVHTAPDKAQVTYQFSGVTQLPLAENFVKKIRKRS